MDDARHTWTGRGLFALWLLSLALPAVGGAAEPPAPGYEVLAVGIFGVLNLQFGWFANPLLLLALPVAMRPRPSQPLMLGLGLGIAVLALQAAGWNEMVTDTGRHGVTIGPGFYVWLAAMFASAGWLFARALSPRGDEGWTATD
jgi:hypothetical protein